MNECLLPFNKKGSFGSVHKVWRVKKREPSPDAKDDLVCSDSGELNIIHEELVFDSLSPLPVLKPLSINTLFVGLGGNSFEKESVPDSIFDLVFNGALRDFGFISPLKISPAVSKGYFLRSCSKSSVGGLGSKRDPFGHFLVKGGLGIMVKNNLSGKIGSGALRALSASLQLP